MITLTEKDRDFVCEIQARCFQALSLDEQRMIQRSRTQVQYRKGETITKQGSFASSLQFVMSGLVRQYIEGEGEKNYNIWMLQPGDFIGLSTLFDMPVYNYSTTAVTETVAFLVEKEALLKIIKSNSTFAYDIISRFNEQHNALFDSIRRMHFKQMNGRLADTLLYLGGERFKDFEVFGNLTRKDIADFTGISTESTVKLLKQYEKDGIIALEDKDIRILNHGLLVEISKRG